MQLQHMFEKLDEISYSTDEGGACACAGRGANNPRPCLRHAHCMLPSCTTANLTRPLCAVLTFKESYEPSVSDDRSDDGLSNLSSVPPLSGTERNWAGQQHMSTSHC